MLSYYFLTNCFLIFNKSWPLRLVCGVASRFFLCRWALWPSAPVPTVHDLTPRPSRGRRRGFHQPTSKSTAAIPSSGSLVATHNYYRRRLGSTSSNSSCGSAEYTGEAIPTTRVSPKQTRDTGGLASSLGSPLSHSWPQCWSPQSTRSLPRPPQARSHVTWLRKLWGSSSPAASLAKPTAGPRPE